MKYIVVDSNLEVLAEARDYASAKKKLIESYERDEDSMYQEIFHGPITEEPKPSATEIDANDSFERSAADFYRATGNLMPGKNGCPRDEDGELLPGVARDYKIWVEARGSVRDLSRKATEIELLEARAQGLEEAANLLCIHCATESEPVFNGEDMLIHPGAGRCEAELIVQAATELRKKIEGMKELKK